MEVLDWSFNVVLFDPDLAVRLLHILAFDSVGVCELQYFAAHCSPKGLGLHVDTRIVWIGLLLPPLDVLNRGHV